MEDFDGWIPVEPGQPQPVFRARFAIPLGGDARLDTRIRVFKTTSDHGQMPMPGSPSGLGFDTDTDTDTAEPAETDRAKMMEGMNELLKAMGSSPAWVHAYHQTGKLPRPDGTFRSEAHRRAWNTAIRHYLDTHPGETLDDNKELGRLRNAAAVALITMVATNRYPGSYLIERLEAPPADQLEIAIVAEFLRTERDRLTSRMWDPDLIQKAAQLALGWSGVALANRVRNADSDTTDLPVLLAVTAAEFSRRHA